MYIIGNLENCFDSFGYYIKQMYFVWNKKWYNLPVWHGSVKTQSFYNTRRIFQVNKRFWNDFSTKGNKSIKKFKQMLLKGFEKTYVSSLYFVCIYAIICIPGINSQWWYKLLKFLKPYRVCQLDMLHFEVPDGQLKLTSKF